MSNFNQKDQKTKNQGADADIEIDTIQGGDQVGGNKINIGDISNAKGIAIDRAKAVSLENVGQVSNVITTDTYISQEFTARRTITKRQAVRPSPTYVPRVEVEEKVRQLILSPSTGLNKIFLTGLPRSGVTTLVQKVATELEEEFPDGTLWADMQKMSKQDILWSFIEPYDQTLDRATLTSTDLYRETLSNLLEDKHVLIVLDHVQSMEDVNAIIQDDFPNIVVLIVSSEGLPGTLDEPTRIHVPKLTESQAEELFRNVWAKDTLLRETERDVITGLAKFHHYMPADIVVAARDILTTQVSPEDYLEDLRNRLQSADPAEQHYAPVYAALFERLPEQAQKLFPYLGVLGNFWGVETLIAVTPYTRHPVEIGLRQLKSRNLVNSVSDDSDDWYATEPIIREFALAKLHEFGNDELVWATRKLAIETYLDKIIQFLTGRRQAILNDIFKDADQRKQFTQGINETTTRLLTKVAAEDDPALRASDIDSLFNSDAVNERFDELVLNDSIHKASPSWAGIYDNDLLLALRHFMERALEWVVEQEDWPLVQSYSKLGIMPVRLNVDEDRDDNRFSFSNTSNIFQSFKVIRESSFSNANLTTVFYATRILNTRWRNCSLLAAKWLGVSVRNSNFTNIDMVGAQMPGLIARNCSFTNIDARMADLRGAKFYNCSFKNVNLQNARLEGMEFIDCDDINIDKRKFRGRIG